jgi:hypothetical protein
VKTDGAPLGYGLYFLDVVACALFCLSFALVGAQRAREVAAPVESPRETAPARAPGSALAGASLLVRGSVAAPELLLDGEALDLASLEARLREAPPAALRIRSEDSLLARAVAVAHAAGVAEIELGYAGLPQRSGGGR